MCDRKEDLIAFLYGELEDSGRRAFQQHLLTCVECRDEVADLRATRGQIAAWTPPEPDLGFRLVRGADTPPPAPRVRVPPAWGLAAAAALVLAIGAAVANLEVRIGGGEGLVVRTGWNHGAAVTASASADRDGTIETVDVQQLDARLREMEQMLARDRSASVRTASASGMTDEEVVRLVREMLAQSETRQQRVLAARLTQITREFDAQRRLDLATISQGMTRLQNTSDAEVRQYREYIQRMYRATAYQQTK